MNSGLGSLLLLIVLCVVVVVCANGYDHIAGH